MRKCIPGIRTLLKFFAAIAAKVDALTGALFHESSLGTESSPFPKFHPGFKAANAEEAVTGVKAAVQDCTAVGVVIVEVWEVGTPVLVFVLSVVAVEGLADVEVGATGPVPGIH